MLIERAGLRTTTLQSKTGNISAISFNHITHRRGVNFRNAIPAILERVERKLVLYHVCENSEIIINVL